MRFARAGYWTAFMAAALAMAAPAKAKDDGPPPLLERVYLDETGFAVWADGPRVEGLGTTIFPNSSVGGPAETQLRDDGQVEGWGGGWDGRLGVGVTEGWAVELGGSYFRVDQDDSDAVSLPDGHFVAFPIIDGLAALGYIFNPGGDNVRIRQDFDGQIDFFDARLGVARDVTVYAEGFKGKARLGIVGGRLEQDYRIDQRTTILDPFTDSSNSQRLDEDLDAWFLGPYLGFEVAGDLTRRLRITLETDLALLYSHADLDASQRLTVPVFDLSTGNDVCGFFGAGECRFDESDAEDHFSARPRARLGLDFDFGPFLLGVTAGVTYWSYAPQVVNPQPEDFDFTVVPDRVSGIGAAHVSSDDLLLADVGVHLTIPLGAPAAGEEALPPLIESLYFEQTGHAVWLSGPRVEGLGTTLVDIAGPTVARAQLDDDSRIEGVGGGWDGRVGVAVAEGWDLELGGSFFRVDQKDSDAVDVAAGTQAMFFPFIDGEVGFGVLPPGPDARLRQDFEGKLDLYDGRLAVARHVEIAGRLHGQVRLGVMAGRLEQDYEIDQRTTEVFPGAPSQDLDEDLDSWFVGPYLGLSLAGEITRRLRVTLDADLGLLYNEADLDASQHFTGIGSSPGFSCGFFPFGQCDFDERDREDHFSARPRARLSFDFDFGPIILGVTGGFTWWSYVPQVVNPQIDFSGAGLGGSGKAHVGGDDLVMADVGLRLTIPLGR